MIEALLALAIFFYGCKDVSKSENTAGGGDVNITVNTERKQIAKPVIRHLNTIKQYLVFTPEGYDGKDAGQKWPLVVFLHGASERGVNIEKIRQIALPKLAADTSADFRFVMISPQLVTKTNWDVDELDFLLSEIIHEYRIDESRILITGMSLGGQGTWNWACQKPARFAAAVPICGWGPSEKACFMKDIPVWAFHGDKDATVKLKESQQMINALRKCGASPRFTVYAGVGHDSWTRTYNNPEVIDWMISQFKPVTGKPN